jgi:uncharacterized Zn finger protein
MRRTPVTSITMTSSRISVLVHGASDPNPVVVNVSTTTCNAWRNSRGSLSNADIP